MDIIKKHDISILFEKPNLEKEAILFIEPLAPLSMVASMPGSFYKTLSEPTHFMIYGMLENLMGWHFSDEIRKNILKSIAKYWKKNFQIDQMTVSASEVGFQPILQNYVSIESSVFLKPHVEYYEDYWTQHLKDSDRRHLGGARNYDWSLENGINQLDNDDDKNFFFKENKDKFPKYYSSPKKREFIHTNGKYGYKIKTSALMLEILLNAINNNQAPTHLGTNEGWVDVSIKAL